MLTQPVHQLVSFDTARSKIQDETFSGEPSGSVILIRFPAGTRTTLPPAVLEIVDRLAEQLSGTFTVIQPGRVRVGRGPGP